ncbi:hypothetical protein CANCADRAFT_32355 [Tortispora caseinolytica NRRL Y-17796]|uniref:protein-tyrosine-phosphatase n=1 Tax=Tortispora caseinolytica NRRL Y-17796 TaxID=767744 RepID=A0A1E4TAX0_9ASCO|nr:hypothetical protein CANCADRAFT_32355 [Tortispora caseinolytica NRRL Y-17796]
MAMHRIDDGLYVGSMYSLQGPNDLRAEGVTHILSVVRGNIDYSRLDGFTIKQIELDDEEDEDIMQYFGQATDFIHSAISQGTGCLIHCQAGISRSVTICCAYLMRYRNYSAKGAIAKVQEGRPIANPNPSFREQLELFEQCNKDVKLDCPAYRQFKLKIRASFATACGQAPELDTYVDDTSPRSAEGADVQLRCKKCRRVLATDRVVVTHKPSESKARLPMANLVANPKMSSMISPYCSQFFTEPLVWMKDELSLGKLEGRLDCPKCQSKVGSYHWQGVRCGCDTWIVPAIGLQRGKVDEIKNSKI